MRAAVDALARRPGRAAATALGIGLASALVVLLLTLSAGVQASSTRLAAASGIDLIATSANTSLSGGSFPPVFHAHALPTQIVHADPNAASVSPWLVDDLLFGNASLYAAANESPNGAAIPSGWQPADSGSVGWIPEENAGLEAPGVVSGAGFSAPGDPLYANGTYRGVATHEVVVDQDLAAVLHVAPGDVVWANPSSVSGPSGVSGWYQNATPFRVVGISQPFFLFPSAELAFFYLSELQVLTGGALGGTDPASIVLIHLADPTNPSSDQATLRVAFPQLSVFTIGNILGALKDVVDLYRTFGVLIGAVGLVVATLFTTTVLLMSVDDRSREIAVMRAVGFSRRAIGASVVQEALLLAGLGLAVGVPLGLAAAVEMNRFLTGLVAGLPSGFSFISIDAVVLGTAALEVIGIGLVASLAPALRAMSLPVAEELRAP